MHGRSRALAAFVSTGLVFMLVPGTLMGVWNLLQIGYVGRMNGGAVVTGSFAGNRLTFSYLESIISF